MKLVALLVLSQQVASSSCTASIMRWSSRPSGLFSDQRIQHRQQLHSHDSVAPPLYESSDIKEKYHAATLYYSDDEWEETALIFASTMDDHFFLTRPGALLPIPREEEGLFTALLKSNSTFISSASSSSVSTATADSHRSTECTWRSQQLPPALDRAGTRCWRRTFTIRQLQQREINLLQRQNDVAHKTLWYCTMGAWDVLLLLVFIFFGLNSVLKLQQRNDRSGKCDDIHPRPPNPLNKIQVPPFESDCPCCFEPYDVAPTTYYEIAGDVGPRLPLLSEVCIHGYCLQCARQDQERLVQLKSSTTPAITALEKCYPALFLLTGGGGGRSKICNAAIRCPFCRQANAFDIHSPILRPDAYDAYVESKSNEGR